MTERLETETPLEYRERRNRAEINGPVNFLFYVWLMENGDDQYRPVAATMDEGDAEAIATRIVDEQAGAIEVLEAGKRPLGQWYI
jgi:hypothetical protein